MRSILALLLALLVGYLGSPVSAPAPPPPPAPKPAVHCSPCIHSPAEWGKPEDRPAPHEGSFWAPDRPEMLPPADYGVVTHHGKLRVEWSVGTYELNAPLPEAPKEMPVYNLGHYPDGHRAMLAQYVADPRVWEYHPAYGLLQHVGVQPLGQVQPIASADEAARRAADLLGPLQMPDSKTPVVLERENRWTVLFYRHVEGWKVYSDKPLTVHLNRSGQAVGLYMRRRPLLSASVYPLRTAEDAWKLLQDGKGFVPYIVENPSVSPLGKTESFVVTKVELAYHEGHADFPSQLMQPYFLFWNEQGQVLAVPAIADSQVKW